jgi:hypothetical protein
LEEEALIQVLETPCQLEPPTNHLKRAKVQEVISGLNPKKLLGHDFVTGTTFKELPTIRIKSLTQLFNVVLISRTQKVAQIIISKPGKPPNKLISYWPISF